MRQIMILTLLTITACTPKPDTGSDSTTDTACDTGETGIPSTCEPRMWYADGDGDGDGYGVDIPGTTQRACTRPGENWSTQSGDCDDADADIHPGAHDLHGDAVDSDCDGSDG